MSELTEVPVRHDSRSAGRATFASFVGSAIEWYDFAVFGTISALVFDKLFFAQLSPALGAVAALLTVGLGYVARPLGAVIFGQVGDRVSRKGMLIWSLALMGSATALIGLLPTYASIGVWAPAFLLLLRFLQGVSVGGEWGGAMTLTAEHAPDAKRGMLTGFAQWGGGVGPLMGVGIVAVVSSVTGDAFLTWGWRIPFLFSIVMLAVGVYIRLRVEESPVFDATVIESEASAASSFVDVLRTAPGRLLLGIGITLAPLVGSTIVQVFMISYAQRFGYARQDILNGMLVAIPVNMVVSLGAAILSDRWARRPVYITGAVILAASSFALFPMVQSGNAGLLILGHVLYYGIGHAIMWGTMGALLPELFPVTIRSTGASLGYQLGSVVAGFVPALSATIVSLTGSSVLIPCLVSVAALITVATVLGTKETARRALQDVEQPA